MTAFCAASLTRRSASAPVGGVSLSTTSSVCVSFMWSSVYRTGDGTHAPGHHKNTCSQTAKQTRRRGPRCSYM